MPTRDDDTVRIGVHPGIKNLRFVVGSAGGLAAVLGAPASTVFTALGAGDSSWPLGVLSVWLIFAGLLLLGVSLAYDVIEWNPRLRTASMRRRALSFRRRTVPIDTITEAWRSVSSAANGTDSTIYRFVSTDGAASRVLVKGGPMAGLDAQGLRALAAFVGALPLEVPDAAAPAARDRSRSTRGHARDGIPALTERQRAAAVSRTFGGGKSRVSQDTLLDEIDAFIAAEESTDPSGFVSPTGARDRADGARPAKATARRPFSGIRSLIALFKADRFDVDCVNDDAEALAVLEANPSRAARLRRLLSRALVGCITAGMLTIAAAVVLEVIGSRLLDSDLNDIVALLFGCAMLLSLVFYVGWCAAADADVRHRRRLARSWMAGRDDDERERGLAEPFVLAWEEQSGRLRTAVAYSVSMIGAVAVVIAVSIAFATTSLPLLTTLGILVSGLAVVALGVMMFVGVARQRRLDAEEIVYLGGRRMLPN
jgi:hypothetical protein